jgi:hypothetical protein
LIDHHFQHLHRQSAHPSVLEARRASLYRAGRQRGGDSNLSSSIALASTTPGFTASSRVFSFKKENTRRIFHIMERLNGSEQKEISNLTNVLIKLKFRSLDSFPGASVYRSLLRAEPKMLEWLLSKKEGLAERVELIRRCKEFLLRVANEQPHTTPRSIPTWELFNPEVIERLVPWLCEDVLGDDAPSSSTYNSRKGDVADVNAVDELLLLLAHTRADSLNAPPAEVLPKPVLPKPIAGVTKSRWRILSLGVNIDGVNRPFLRYLIDTIHCEIVAISPVTEEVSRSLRGNKHEAAVFDSVTLPAMHLVNSEYGRSPKERDIVLRALQEGHLDTPLSPVAACISEDGPIIVAKSFCDPRFRKSQKKLGPLAISQLHIPIRRGVPNKSPGASGGTASAVIGVLSLISKIDSSGHAGIPFDKAQDVELATAIAGLIASTGTGTAARRRGASAKAHPFSRQKSSSSPIPSGGGNAEGGGRSGLGMSSISASAAPVAAPTVATAPVAFTTEVSGFAGDTTCWGEACATRTAPPAHDVRRAWAKAKTSP